MKDDVVDPALPVEVGNVVLEDMGLFDEGLKPGFGELCGTDPNAVLCEGDLALNFDASNNNLHAAKCYDASADNIDILSPSTQLEDERGTTNYRSNTNPFEVAHDYDDYVNVTMLKKFENSTPEDDQGSAARYSIQDDLKSKVDNNRDAFETDFSLLSESVDEDDDVETNVRVDNSDYQTDTLNSEKLNDLSQLMDDIAGTLDQPIAETQLKEWHEQEIHLDNQEEPHDIENAESDQEIPQNPDTNDLQKPPPPDQTDKKVEVPELSSQQESSPPEVHIDEDISDEQPEVATHKDTHTNTMLDVRKDYDDTMSTDSLEFLQPSVQVSPTIYYKTT